MAATNPAGPVTPPAGAYPETTDGLKRLWEDLLAAQRAGDQNAINARLQGLILPDHDAWFRKTFGEAQGAKVAAGYAQRMPQFEEAMRKILAERIQKNQVDVRVTRFERANDPVAVGHQKRALELMKQPVPLYSVRMVAPGQPAGFHLYSFAYIDGGWRLLGDMRTLE
jgi:hypothetical protein